MKTSFTASFAKDLQRVKERTTRQRVAALITAMEQAPSTEEMVNLKRLKGANRAYRIRLGDYRVGILIRNDTVTFVRFLQRREIYCYFP